MKRKVYAAVLVIVTGLIITDAVEARRPSWGGHAAVAVSPNGETIAVGGVGRTLYILDAATMQVTDRHWHGAQIDALAFNADGPVLIMEDETGTLHLLDSGSRAAIQSIKDADYVSLSMAGDRMAALTGRGLSIAGRHARMLRRCWPRQHRANCRTTFSIRSTPCSPRSADEQESGERGLE